MKITFKNAAVLFLVIGSILSALFLSQSGSLKGSLPPFKIQKINVPKVVVPTCLQPREYRDILHCYPSLISVRNHLQTITVTLPDTTKVRGDDFVLRLLQTYDGNAAYQIKEKFIATNIDNNQFELLKTNQYIFRVVHMLWFERNGNAPWSIKTYTPNQVDALVLVTGLFPNDRLAIPNIQDPIHYNDDQGWWEHLSFPAFIELSAPARNFIAPNHQQTAVNAIRWYKKNFFHSYTDDNNGNTYNWERYNDHIPTQRFGLDGAHFALPNSLGRQLEERVSGCQDAGLIFSNMLRSINIPAVDLGGNSAHKIVYIATINKFVHGDHLVEHSAAFPADRLLLTPVQMAAIDTPESSYENYFANAFDTPEKQIFLVGSWLKRNGNTLYVQTGTWCNPLSEETMRIIQQELGEFHLHPSAEGCYSLVGDSLPILTVDQLN
ncbi:hypothetical protein KBD59_02025 [Candidatus Gracilibacteria bacterium]|nr:hypothetical protein [Candidatus Gracilibacteria bacterium]